MTYKLLLAFAWIIRHLPRSWILAFGRLLGGLLYLILPYRKLIAWSNLSRAFPELSPSQRRAILRRAYRHFGVVIMDFLRLPKITTRHTRSIIDFDETSLREAQEQGKGILIMTGHLGNWELIVPALVSRGYRFIPVIVPQKGSGGALINTLRQSTGCRYISKRTPTRTMIRLLNEGNFLGLVGDQDARKRGVWISFLGQSSSRPRGGAVFALQTGASMLAGCCILKKDGHYKLSFTPVSTEDLPHGKAQAVQALTQRYMDILEEAVRRHPEQYFWFHKMWKTRS